MKILIVDDQELVQLSLEKCLTDLNYEVIIADSAKEAILKYDEYILDLVIVDINMHPLDDGSINNTSVFDEKGYGLEVVKYIKQVKKDTTPVMMLSGNNNEEVIVKALELGADDYMKKPLSLNEIAVRVNRLIGADDVSLVENKN
jgi:DNA-binding response OmpR family regulator